MDALLQDRDVDPVEIIGARSTKNYEINQENETVYALMSDFVYTNPTLAVVREYIANAWDSHKEAGRTDTPIDVTFSEDPLRLIIHDFGMGLEANQMDTVFRKYLLSTKSDDIDSTGKFGIGSKSGFSYTDNFVSIGIKNGLKVVYANHIGENRRPKISQMTKSEMGAPTTEPDGVTIDIPVKSLQDLRQFRSYLDEIIETTTIKVRILDGDGLSVVANHSDFGSQLKAHGFGYHPKYSNTGLHVVQEDICYPVPAAILNHLIATHNLDANIFRGLHVRVPNGSLQYPLSREHIRDTETNRQRLGEYLLLIQAAITKEFEALVTSHTKTATLSEFITFAHRSSSNHTLLNRDDPRYKTPVEKTSFFGPKELALRYAITVTANGGTAPIRANSLFIAANQRYQEKFNSIQDFRKFFDQEKTQALADLTPAFEAMQAEFNAKIIFYEQNVQRSLRIKANPPSLWGPSRCYLPGATPTVPNNPITALYAENNVRHSKTFPLRNDFNLIFDMLTTPENKTTVVFRPTTTTSIYLTHPTNTRSITNAIVIVPNDPHQSLQDLYTPELRRFAAAYGFEHLFHIDQMEHLSNKPKPARIPRIVSNDQEIPAETNTLFNWLHPQDCTNSFKTINDDSRTIPTEHASATTPPTYFALAIYNNPYQVLLPKPSTNAHFINMAKHLAPFTGDQIGIIKNKREGKKFSEAGSTQIFNKEPKNLAQPTSLQLQALTITHALVAFETHKPFMKNPARTYFFTKIIRKFEADTGHSFAELFKTCVPFATQTSRNGMLRKQIEQAAKEITQRLIREYPLLVTTANYYSDDDFQRHNAKKIVHEYINLIDATLTESLEPDNFL